MPQPARRRSRSKALLCTAMCTAAVWALAPAAFGAQQVITSSGPLTEIYLNDNLQCQARHAGDSVYSFFPSGNTQGNCATFIAVQDPVQQNPPTVYGPLLSNATAYGLVSQTPVSGSGSSGDPFVVTTVVNAGSTGLQVRRTDSYVVGQAFYRSDITVSNSSTSSRSAVLYHAADCYLQGSDSGYGFYDSSGGGIFCSANPNNSPAARVLGFVPVSSGSHFYEAGYNEVFAGVNGQDLPDICECDLLQDNGAGLSWSITVPAGGSVRRSLATAVSPTGVVPDPDPPPPPPPPPPPDTTPPDTPITSGPPAVGTDTTPTFTFESTEPASTFTCSIDGGLFLPCTSPFTTPELPDGSHTVAIRATDAAGNTDPTPTEYNFEISVALEDLPTPELGEEVNVGPVPGSGPIFIAVPGQGGGARASARASQKGLTFVPLTDARQVPTGSFLDTKRGTVQLVSATGSGPRTQSGKFGGGLFQVLQSRARRARGLTEVRLKGGNFNRCRTGRRGRSAGAAQVSRRTVRRVRSNTSGRYRSRGRNSAGTVRGTVWITADRCDGTLTTVKRGSVAVRDFRRKRTVIVRAGKTYLARAPQ